MDGMSVADARLVRRVARLLVADGGVPNVAAATDAVERELNSESYDGDGTTDVGFMVDLVVSEAERWASVGPVESKIVRKVAARLRRRGATTVDRSVALTEVEATMDAFDYDGSAAADDLADLALDAARRPLTDHERETAALRAVERRMNAIALETGASHGCVSDAVADNVSGPRDDEDWFRTLAVLDRIQVSADFSEPGSGHRSEPGLALVSNVPYVNVPYVNVPYVNVPYVLRKDELQVAVEDLAPAQDAPDCPFERYVFAQFVRDKRHGCSLAEFDRRCALCIRVLWQAPESPRLTKIRGHLWRSENPKELRRAIRHTE